MVQQYEKLGITLDEGWYVVDGCSHETDLDAIWCGIFGFCGCGNVFGELLKILDILDKLDHREKIDMKDQIYLYILDEKGFTEHGFSIFGSYLTDKGFALKKILQLNKETLDEYR